jgi:hypothetical protein
VSKRQKTLFAEPPPDGDIEYIGETLPGDFADYILLELKEFDPGEELLTLEELDPVEVRVIVGPLGGKQP